MKIKYLSWGIKVFRSFSLASVSTFFGPKLPRLCDWKKCDVFYNIPTGGLPITHCWELNCTNKKKKKNNNNRKKKTEKSKHRIKVIVNWNFWLPWAGFTSPERPSRNWLLKEKSLSLGHTCTASCVFSFSPVVFCLN